MISEVQIELMLNMIRAQDEGTPPNFSAVKTAIEKKYCETYSVRMLERLYQAEKNNPKFKPKEVPVPYIDLAKE